MSKNSFSFGDSENSDYLCSHELNDETTSCILVAIGSLSANAGLLVAPCA
jgi:hypothetical protein